MAAAIAVLAVYILNLSVSVLCDMKIWKQV